MQAKALGEKSGAFFMRGAACGKSAADAACGSRGTCYYLRGVVQWTGNFMRSAVFSAFMILREAVPKRPILVYIRFSTGGRRLAELL